MLWARHPPGFIAPRLPTDGRTVPTGPQWVCEIKHDGVCRRDGDRVRVFSRRGHDWTDRVPLIPDALGQVGDDRRQGVVCRPDGVSDFDRLRAAVGRKRSRKAFLFAFDILELDGVDVGMVRLTVGRQGSGGA